MNNEEKNLNKVLSDYICETGENESGSFKYETIISCNLYNDSLNRAGKEKEERLKGMSLIEIKKMNEDYTGLFLAPKDITKNFTILINATQVDKDCSYRYTFAHELTHFYDYSKYMNDYNIKTENELEHSQNYWSLYCWSEFHARYYTCKYIRKYIDITKEDELELIKSSDFLYHMDVLNNYLDNYNTIGGLEVLTEIIYDYGRFIYYKECGFNAIEQKEFPKDKIIKMFGNLGIEIYDLFENLNTYDKFNKNIIEITKMINKIGISFETFQIEEGKE